MPDQERIEYLLSRYAEQKTSQDEEMELFDLIINSEYEDDVKSTLIQMLTNSEANTEFDNSEWQPVLENILQTKTQSEEKLQVIQLQPKRKILQWTRFAAAAVFIFAIAGATLFFFNHPTTENVAKVNTTAADKPQTIVPGGNKATLTLDNGSAITLDHAANGKLAEQGNIKIVKSADGQLAYEANSANNTAKIYHNTISTPRGGQFQVTLSDGTKVWLNSASSLTYSTAFNGTERDVQLKGEAYFEVAKNAAMPFHVTANGMHVEVLGTHFNIMSYDDEGVYKTTLLEGSVKISNSKSNTLLKPGQQAQLTDNSNIKLLQNVDTDKVVAWKNGDFSFKNDSILEVVKQLSRWYNADFIIKNPILQYYTGTIKKDQDISKVLEMLELTGGEHFEIKGTQVIVTGK